MANPKGHLKNLTHAGKGRPKGSKNRYTDLKSAFIFAFENTGGEKALAEWASEEKNRGAFYQMITKLLPNRQEITNNNKGDAVPMEITITHEIIKPPKK